MKEPKISKKQQAHVNKYISKAYDRINLTVPKGQKDIIKAHAEAKDKSLNGFIQKAIQTAMDESDREQAYWIYHTDELFPAESKQECSNCHEKELYSLSNENYCPNCGAEMSKQKKG